MTEQERRTLRLRIDKARRERVARERRIQLPQLNPDEETRPCAYCGRPFPVPAGPNARTKRFCCTTHKANWFRRERMRRERQAA